MGLRAVGQRASRPWIYMVRRLDHTKSTFLFVDHPRISTNDLMLCFQTIILFFSKGTR